MKKDKFRTISRIKRKVREKKEGLEKKRQNPDNRKTFGAEIGFGNVPGPSSCLLVNSCLLRLIEFALEH